MNPNRESELRRRLEMTEIPPPPAGLADRIRGDIPDDLFSGKELVRSQRTRLFPLQIAASVLLLAGSAYMVTRVLIIGEPAAVQTAAVRKAAPVVATAGGKESSTPDIQSFDTMEEAAPPPLVADVRQEAMAEPRANVERQVAAPSALIAEAEPASKKDKRWQEDRDQAVSESTAAATPQAPSRPGAAPSIAMADAQAAPPSAMKPGAEASADAVAPAELKSSARARSDVPTRRAIAAGVAQIGSTTASSTTSPRIFGISVDQSSIARVRETLGRGESPSASSINGEAFISYFSGRGKRNASVSLDAEGSTMPSATSGRKVLLRFSVDTAVADSTRGPVGRDARIDIAINPDAVARFRRIGGDEKLSAAEPLLQRDVSVTAVYELELLPRTKRPQQVVVVTMRYRDAATGHPKMLSKRLDVRDFESSWTGATRRHRLATLSGLLSESLQGTPTGIDLARRAEELANQEPNDVRARELANVASASSRLRSSSPTGSGR